MKIRNELFSLVDCGQEGGEREEEALLPGNEEKNGASTADATNESENKTEEVSYALVCNE